MGPAGGASEWTQAIARLGHELRTPLTVVRGAATLLVEAHRELSPDRLEEMLRLIDASAATMAERIEDLVTAGQLESGQVRLDPRPLEVAALLEAAVAWGERHRLAISCRPPEAGLRVRADRDHSAQVLRLLLGNVERFAAGGAVRLEAEAKPAAVRFTVADSGPGLPEGVREHLFERFAGAQGARAGAGLGLHLVRGLTRAMGGDAGLQESGPAGSTFWFTLLRDA